MPGSAATSEPRRRRLAGGAGILLAMLCTPSQAQERPLPRVMSLNICTDQLVLALAAPAQIVSLSALASDPNLSVLHAQALAYPRNRGMAEEVFVARPDVIVTGTYSLHNTTALLRHLGLRIEEFDYGQTLDSIPGDIRRMGALIDRAGYAEILASGLETEIARLALPSDGPRPSVIVYGQNGVVMGAGTLADSLLTAVGFRNLAAERGVAGMAPYPLELLVRDRPDLVLLSPPYADAPALADQIAHHPAIAALGDAVTMRTVARGAWSCGGPFTLEALKTLRALRDGVAARGPAG